jgi:raffinose/stachyose/melibiose transport system substrate-binding protein
MESHDSPRPRSVRRDRTATHLAVAAAMTSAVLLSACSNGPSSSSSGSSAAPVANPTANLRGVTLTMWTGTGDAHQADEVIKAFKSATGATVNRVTIPDTYETNVQTKLASGSKPDLMDWQPTQSALTSIRGSQILQPLSGQSWETHLTPTVATLGKIDNTRYAAPITIPSTIGVYYNKKVFAQLGIAVPQTWSAMIADAQKIKAGGVAPFYEAGKDQWPLQFPVQVQLTHLTKSGTFWPKLNKNQASWTDPAIVQAITNYNDQIIKGGLANADYQSGTFVNQGSELLSGKAAMAINLNALLGEMQTSTSLSQLNDTIGFFPISPDGPIGTYVPDHTNALVAPKTGDTTRENAAKQFIAFWLGPNYKSFIADQKTVSIEKSVPTPATVPDAAQASAKALDNSVPALQVESIITPNIEIYLGDMLFGKKTPLQVAQACQTQFTQQATAQGVAGF